MLRTFVLLLSIALMAAGLFVSFVGGHVAWPMLIWCAILFLGTVFERWRYGANARREGEGWVATDERFIDPESGKLMQVYYQASTGERRYEPIDDR